MMNEESLKTWEQDHIELLTSREMGEWLFRRDNRRDMNARPQDEWIPVSERLPEEKVAVLVYVSTGTSKTFCLANWNNFYGGWEDWLSDKLIEKELGYKVIAWQPLPEPYKKGGAE